MTDVVETLDGFLHAYPEDIFPAPAPENQAVDAAAAHVMRRLALPTMALAKAEIVRLQTANTELVEAIGNWWGDGCDADPDHDGHPTWCEYDDIPEHCICGRITLNAIGVQP